MVCRRPLLHSLPTSFSRHPAPRAPSPSHPSGPSSAYRRRTLGQGRKHVALLNLRRTVLEPNDSEHDQALTARFRPWREPCPGERLAPSRVVPSRSTAVSTVTQVKGASTFASRRSTLDFGLGGQRSLRAARGMLRSSRPGGWMQSEWKRAPHPPRPVPRSAYLGFPLTINHVCPT